jgi:hypothetical protein
VAERVHDAQLDHLISQQAQTSGRTAVWSLRAGQADELRLLLSVELPFVLTIRALATDAAFEAPLREAPTNAADTSSR